MRLPDFFLRSPGLAAPVTALLGATLISGATLARTYSEVEVRGAKLIPAEDIAQTCGDLTSEELAEEDLIEIESCLMSTGVFDEVALRSEGEVLVINVTETVDKPGRIEGSIAWVEDRGLTVALDYSQFNLIPGTHTSARIDHSEDLQSLELGLFRADAFTETLGLGFSLDAYRADYDELSFSKRAVMAEIYLVSTPTEALRFDYGIGYRSHKMFGLSPTSSALLWQETGADGTRSEEGAFLHLAARWKQGSDDDPRDYHLKLDQYLWNIGADSRVSETRIEAGLRQDLGEHTSLHLRLRGGKVSASGGESVTALDRFFIGGSDFRGFAPRGLGPADGNDLLGANKYLTGSIELGREMGDVMEAPVSASLFYDFGSSWGLDDTLGGAIDDGSHFRSSVGVAVSFDLGGLPVSLYAATPLRELPQDRAQIFGLSVAARF